MTTTVDVAAINQALQEAARVATELAAAQSALLASIITNTQELGDNSRGRRDNTDTVNDESSARDILNALTARQQEILQELADAETALIAIQQTHGRGSQQEITQQQEIIRLRREQTLIDADVADASDALGRSMRNAGKQSSVLGAALGILGNVAKFQVGRMLDQYKAAEGLLESSGDTLSTLFDNQLEGIKRGVSGIDLVELTNKHRQLVNAMGGTKKALSVLDPSINTFRILTLDNAKAMQYAAHSAQNLADRGIRPTQQGLADYSQQMLRVRQLTGLGNEAALEHIASITSDIEFASIIRSTRESERAELLRGTNALHEHNLALGMSRDQALAASKALSAIAAQKPLTRIKQAARIRALAGALGIAGGNEAAEATLAGARRTSDQQAALSAFLTAATNKVDASRGSGSGLGQELSTSVLVDKLGLDELVGQFGAFSTSAASVNAPVASALSALQTDISTPLGKAADALTIAAGALQEITGKTGALTGLLSTVGGVAAGAAAALLGRRTGRGGPPPPPNGGGGRVSGKLKAAGAGALVAGAATLFGDTVDPTESPILSGGLNTVAAAATGASLGALVGPIGAAIGGAIGLGVGLYQNFGKTDSTKPSSEKAISSKTQAPSPAEKSLSVLAQHASSDSVLLASIVAALNTLNATNGKQVELLAVLAQQPTPPPIGVPATRTAPARTRGSYNYVG